MEIEKKSRINDYILIKKLGEGFNSKVKLGMNKNDGKYYAVKVIRETNNADNNIKAVLAEAKILKELNHPNILRLYEIDANGTYEKSDGTTKKVLFEVLQLAEGGEIFDFISIGGKFSEPIARFYFQQMISALDHLHSKGFAHRDMKPENLLLDKDFNLLLADFGFSALLAGKDGSGKMRSILGTENYMAPEIHSKAPYLGTLVDLFAAGIILFIFVSGHPPFSLAKASDSYYGLICMNNHEKFWHFHSRKKAPGFYSEDFKNLINAMLAFDPTQRPSIAEIKAHPWFNGPTATHQEVLEEFNTRKEKVEAVLDAKKKEVEQKAQMRQTQTNNVAFTGVKANFRSIEVEKTGADDFIIDDNDDLREQVKSLRLERGAPVYETTVTRKLTTVYSEFSPEQMLKQLAFICNKVNKNAKLNTDKFSVQTKVPGNYGMVCVEMTVFGLGFGSAVEFHKREGDHFEFMPIVEKIKEGITDRENQIYTPAK